MQQFSIIAELFVAGGIGSAIVIAADLRGCRQQMRIMRPVWILTALWASFFGLWAYFAFGRDRRCRKPTSQPPAAGNAPMQTDGIRVRMPPPDGEGSGTTAREGGPAIRYGSGRMPASKNPRGNDRDDTTHVPTEERSSSGAHVGSVEMRTDGSRAEEMRMEGMADDPAMSGMHANDATGTRRPDWRSVVLSTLHCGAGCTLADLLGEWLLFFVPAAIGGSLLAGSWAIDYLLALLFGIGFQYAAIREMEPRAPVGKAVRRAAKADFLSLTAWQAGMYGWMAVAIFVIGNGTALPRTSFGFWFMMQIAMAFGFLAALPVNVLLIRYGIKKGM